MMRKAGTRKEVRSERQTERGHSSPLYGWAENPPSCLEGDSGEDRGMKIEEFQFPSDWNLGPIAGWFDFTTKPRGLDLSKNGDEIPFFPMDQIPLGRIRVSEFTPKPLSQLGSGTYVENGDLMVAKITPSFENGKQAIVDIETDFAYATTEGVPMRGRSGVSDTLFLFFYLLHPEVRSDLAVKMEGSTGRQRLSKTVLGDRFIPLPPLPEQKKIAHILSPSFRGRAAEPGIQSHCSNFAGVNGTPNLTHLLVGSEFEIRHTGRAGPLPRSAPANVRLRRARSATSAPPASAACCRRARRWSRSAWWCKSQSPRDGGQRGVLPLPLAGEGWGEGGPAASLYAFLSFPQWLKRTDTNHTCS